MSNDQEQLGCLENPNYCNNLMNKNSNLCLCSLNMVNCYFFTYLLKIRPLDKIIKKISGLFAHEFKSIIINLSKTVLLSLFTQLFEAV